MVYKVILFQYIIVLSTRDVDRGYEKAAVFPETSIHFCKDHKLLQ